MTDPRPLDGKLALVTGASRGIGAATAEALGKAGAHVILTARTVSALETVEEAIHGAGGAATIAPLDLSDLDTMPKLAAAIAERWGSLDILVLNAAMLGTLAPVEHLELKELDRLFKLNVLANQQMLHAFNPLLRRAERADVVALTSSVGETPRAFWGGYGASKAALDTMMGAYADENERLGKIRVHLIDPGATRTRMRQNAFPGEEPGTVKAPDVVARAIVERLTGDMPAEMRVRVEG